MSTNRIDLVPGSNVFPISGINPTRIDSNVHLITVTFSQSSGGTNTIKTIFDNYLAINPSSKTKMRLVYALMPFENEPTPINDLYETIKKQQTAQNAQSMVNDPDPAKTNFRPSTSGNEITNTINMDASSHIDSFLWVFIADATNFNAQQNYLADFVLIRSKNGIKCTVTSAFDIKILSSTIRFGGGYFKDVDIVGQFLEQNFVQEFCKLQLSPPPSTTVNLLNLILTFNHVTSKGSTEEYVFTIPFKSQYLNGDILSFPINDAIGSLFPIFRDIVGTLQLRLNYASSDSNSSVTTNTLTITDPIPSFSIDNINDPKSVYKTGDPFELSSEASQIPFNSDLSKYKAIFVPDDISILVLLFSDPEIPVTSFNENYMIFRINETAGKYPPGNTGPPIPFGPYPGKMYLAYSGATSSGISYTIYSNGVPTTIGPTT